jgi:hydroxymethylbilane synthase
VLAARLEDDVFVPAPGQGALLVQARADTRAEAVDDPAAHAALATERAVAAKLGASCHTAIGVQAADGAIRAFVGLPDGSEWLLDEVTGADGADDRLAARLLSMGAADLLARAEAMTA